ncbi:MAG TPA: hypothetical protein VN896_12220 [Methylomirabilota bacterium]|jgi:hypothetical protein|nr:hypothetical protein [Methylomirabilota bacterium]
MLATGEVVSFSPVMSTQSVPIETRPRRRRGRPLEMSPGELLQRIRERAEIGGLFRVHLAEPALYARARRLFGSWAHALAAAGLDHTAAVSEARRRAHETRRRPRS